MIRRQENRQYRENYFDCMSRDYVAEVEKLEFSIVKDIFKTLATQFKKDKEKDKFLYLKYLASLIKKQEDKELRAYFLNMKDMKDFVARFVLDWSLEVSARL